MKPAAPVTAIARGAAPFVGRSARAASPSRRCTAVQGHGPRQDDRDYRAPDWCRYRAVGPATRPALYVRASSWLKRHMDTREAGTGTPCHEVEAVLIDDMGGGTNPRRRKPHIRPEIREGAVAGLGSLRRRGLLTAAQVEGVASGLGVTGRSVWRWLSSAAEEGRAVRRPRRHFGPSGPACRGASGPGETTTPT